MTTARNQFERKMQNMLQVLNKNIFRVEQTEKHFPDYIFFKRTVFKPMSTGLLNAEP